MTNEAYLLTRQKYGRPQGLLFANNPGEIDPTTGKYVPTGTEGIDYVILSDDNRGDINIGRTRLETRKRMINGRMRSYHVADKATIGTSWNMLPSRSYADGTVTVGDYSYTSDGGAGGVEILDWYEQNTGSFWVYLAYDKYNNFTGVNKMSKMNQYNEVIEVFFSDFSYNVIKRGAALHDYWNITFSLEEA
jgi:hypothetical protein